MFFYFSMTSYFDPINFCRIKTKKDFFNGNVGTIKKAIKLIKNNNPEDYRTLCKYVDTIGEGNCLISPTEWGEAPCYVKGSKLIYLKPNKNNSPEIIKSRAEAIIKYSHYSQNFWENK